MPRQSDMYTHDMTRIGGTGIGLTEIQEDIAIVALGMMNAMSVVVDEMITGGMIGEIDGIVEVIGAAPAVNIGKYNGKSTIAYLPLDLIS